MVANLVHPHVVTVHNLGTDRDYHFIEMEYVPGGISLQGDAGQGRPAGADPGLEPGPPGRPGPGRRARLGAGPPRRQAGQRPADAARPRQARRLRPGPPPQPSPGLAGAKVAGTPTFMAPELFSGDAASPRSDLYAVGVMFYYLLSARLPFAADRIGRLIRAAPPTAGARHPPARPGRQRRPRRDPRPLPGQGALGPVRVGRGAGRGPRRRPSPSSATPRGCSARPSRGSTASSRGPATTSGSSSSSPTTGSRRSTWRSARTGTTSGSSRSSRSAARPSRGTTSSP